MPAAKLQADAVNLAAAIHGRKAVADDSLGGVFDRTGEDFAVGKVLMTVAVDPLAAVDAQSQVGPLGRDEADLLLAVEIVDHALLTFADLAPGGGRIVAGAAGRRGTQSPRRLASDISASCAEPSAQGNCVPTPAQLSFAKSLHEPSPCISAAPG